VKILTSDASLLQPLTRGRAARRRVQADRQVGPTGFVGRELENPKSEIRNPNSLSISPDAHAYICLHRPELAPAFEIVGGQASIPIESLLRPGPNQSAPCSELQVRGWLVGRASPRAVDLEFGRAGSSVASPHPNNSEPGIRNAEPSRGFGDALAALLRILGIHAVITLFQRRGLIRGCQCAARQARLNSLTPRLLGLLEPWPLTLAVILSWLLFALALLVR
jgi:hypothetical protein